MTYPQRKHAPGLARSLVTTFAAALAAVCLTLGAADGWARTSNSSAQTKPATAAAPAKASFGSFSSSKQADTSKSASVTGAPKSAGATPTAAGARTSFGKFGDSKNTALNTTSTGAPSSSTSPTVAAKPGTMAAALSNAAAQAQALKTLDARQADRTQRTAQADDRSTAKVARAADSTTARDTGHDTGTRAEYVPVQTQQTSTDAFGHVITGYMLGRAANRATQTPPPQSNYGGAGQGSGSPTTTPTDHTSDTPMDEISSGASSTDYQSVDPQPPKSAGGFGTGIAWLVVLTVLSAAAFMAYVAWKKHRNIPTKGRYSL